MQKAGPALTLIVLSTLFVAILLLMKFCVSLVEGWQYG